MAEGMVRVSDPADPKRCQAIGKFGQCVFEALEDTQQCKIHAGAHTNYHVKKREKRVYRLGVYQEEFDDLMESGQIKHLYEEICLMRVLIQNYLNTIAKSPTEMMRLSPVISNHVITLDKLIKSCDLMERQAGQLLDKGKAQVLGQELAELVAKYVTDPEVMLKIGEGMSQILDRLDTQ